MATVYGSNGSDTINLLNGATNFDDKIYGLNGDDKLYGVAGNDWLKGGAGADRLDGGVGVDTANYSDSDEGVTVSLLTGTGDHGSAEGDTLFNIENVEGSEHDDILIGNAGDNVLNGVQGDDLLKGGGGIDTLYGGHGNDVLVGGAGADKLWGGHGINTADYSASPTAVFINLSSQFALGGDANGDQLHNIQNLVGSDYNDTLWGDEWVNVLEGGEGADSLGGLGGDDELYGGAGIDTLSGGEGNDLLDGGAEVDTLAGGAGDDDYYYYGGPKDTIVEVINEGTQDRVFAMADYTLTASNVEIVSLALGSAISATGNGENNTIVGNAQNNVIDGGGNGTIGGDSLSGGLGNDRFVFWAGQAHGDTIYDFQPGDSLEFINYGTEAEGASFVHLAGNDWQVTSAYTLISEIIVIVGVSAINPSDIIFDAN